MRPMNEIKAVGARGEKSLHAALKRWYAQPGDQVEAMVDGYRVDIVRDDLLIEIQTHNFGALRDKLNRLLMGHTVRLVYPVAVEKWVVRLAADGSLVGRRRSPKRGRIEDVFAELIRFPAMMAHPHFTLEVLLIRAEEQRRNDGLGSWRRKGWSIYDHILLDVIEPVTWNEPEDFLHLLPPPLRTPEGTSSQRPGPTYGVLPHPFTTSDLAIGLGISKSLARKMAYCLYHMGLLTRVGKQGQSVLYAERVSAH
jgi:hypothetical protein